MNIYLTSLTLNFSELEAGKPLLQAFFPEPDLNIFIQPVKPFNEQKSIAAPLVSDDRITKLLKNEVGITFSHKTEQGITFLPQNQRGIILNQGNNLLKLNVVIRIEVKHLDVEYLSTGWKAEGSFYLFDQAEVLGRNLSGQSNEPDIGYNISVKLEQERIAQILSHNQVGKEPVEKLLLKHVLLELLSEVTGKKLPWGILTGIRPSKILHRLEDLGASREEQTAVLQERYAVRQDKVELLQEIVSVQRPYLKAMESNPQAVAVYVGIPFCPTRCTYCSFPSYSLGKGRNELSVYFEALAQEICSAGEMMRSLKFVADNLYIGGGTPTVLNSDELESLLKLLKSAIPLRKDLEFTVEAGRPDSITDEKLAVLKDQGVNRISINPQTMHNRTLQRIGRAHDVASVFQVYEMARSLADWVINMDLILGLPGESIDDVKESLEQIGPLRPDNFTVHALALKRGSQEYETGFRHGLAGEMEEMQEMVLATAKAWGLRPYYLYRQKNIAGNLENIGYARPGLECRYNIGIMEERQNVIGLGAGAASKIINPHDYSLQNLQHPSNWQAYSKRWTELHRNRWDAFNRLSATACQ